MHSRFSKTGLVIAALAMTLLSACATLEERQRARDSYATNEVRISATPKAEPQKTITNFSASLRCMDSLFVRYGIKGLAVGSQDIPDETEVVLAGAKDMLISSLSTMSIKSKAVKFVALGQDLEDVTRFHSLHKGKNFKSPDFFLRGAITQVDRGVIENQISGGLALPRTFSLSASKDRIASIIALDMNMGLVTNLQILPGINSSNSIAVVRKGKGADLSGTIKNLGAVFQVNFTESEGLHHAVRTLIELGAIEIMGKLTQVPYWECLDIETTSSFVQTQIEDWYKSLSREELVKFIQAKLSALDLYEGAVDGQETAQLKSVIALYKSRQGLIADSKPDYMLYYNLISDPTPIRTEHHYLLSKVIQSYPEEPFLPFEEEAEPVEKVVLQNLGLESKRVTPLELTLKTSRGERPVYRPGEKAEIYASTSTDAYLYCYYQPVAGEIIKVFPNRFTPSSRVSAGNTTTIPSDERFSLEMEQIGNYERILCMSSYEDVEQRMPFELKNKSLQPLSLARLTKVYKKKIQSLNDIYTIYKSAAKVIPVKQQLILEVQ